MKKMVNPSIRAVYYILIEDNATKILKRLLKDNDARRIFAQIITDHKWNLADNRVRIAKTILGLGFQW